LKTSFVWNQPDHTFVADHPFPPAQYNYIPYFEILVTNNSGTIAIGVGSHEIQGAGVLPGWKPKSYDYHADDGNAFLANGTGNDYGPTYSIGDVVGCGININRELFFTKNGTHLGVACKLPTGLKVYPLLGIDKGGVSTNFGGSAFKFNISLQFPPSGKSGELNTSGKLAILGEDTLYHILSFMDSTNINKFSQTNKVFCRMSRSDKIWKPLVMKKWPTVSTNIKISSYYSFYKKRYIAVGKTNKTLIENCMDWEFACPVALDKLQRTADREVDFCTVCKKNVYLVHNVEQLKEKVTEHKCVAIDFDNKEKKTRRPMMRGKVARR